MTPSAALIIAICCGPGTNNCGCDRPQDQSKPAWTQEGDHYVLTGTQFTVEYEVVQDDFLVKHGVDRIDTASSKEEAEQVAGQRAIKMIENGQTP